MIDTASGKTGLAPAVRPAWYVDHITHKQKMTMTATMTIMKIMPVVRPQHR